MKVFVSYSFVTDLCGRNVLHANYCPAMCLLKNQSLPLLLWRPDTVHRMFWGQPSSFYGHLG